MQIIWKEFCQNSKFGDLFFVVIGLSGFHTQIKLKINYFKNWWNEVESDDNMECF